MTKKTAHLIDAEAAGWAARIDRGPLEPGEELLFQAWLAGDVRCAGAFGYNDVAVLVFLPASMGPTS